MACWKVCVDMRVLWDCWCESNMSPTGVDHNVWPCFHLNIPFIKLKWGSHIWLGLKYGGPIPQWSRHMVEAWKALCWYESVVRLFPHTPNLSLTRMGPNGWHFFHFNKPFSKLNKWDRPHVHVWLGLMVNDISECFWHNLAGWNKFRCYESDEMLLPYPLHVSNRCTSQWFVLLPSQHTIPHFKLKWGQHHIWFGLKYGGQFLIHTTGMICQYGKIPVATRVLWDYCHTLNMSPTDVVPTGWSYFHLNNPFINPKVVGP